MTDVVEDKPPTLWSFETNLGSANAGKLCLRCQRAVLCALLNGAPFCGRCLVDAATAIDTVLAESSKGAGS